MSCGVLTMAYGPESYLRMAKGLARSIRLRNPDFPLAIVTDRAPSELRRCFDVVVPMNPDFGPGLAQKLHLDKYAPFDKTLYMDADSLVFKDLRLIWDQFRDCVGLGLLGFYLDPGVPHYAIDDLPSYLRKVGIPRIVLTNTGILYLDGSPTTTRVFETARAIATRAQDLGLKKHPAGFYNDEPIFGSVVELLGLPFVRVADHRDAGSSVEPVLTLACFGTDGMTDIDVRSGNARHELSGRTVSPAVIHFNVDSQGSRIYDRELRRLEYRWLGQRRLADAITTTSWSLRRVRETLQRRVLS